MVKITDPILVSHFSVADPLLFSLFDVVTLEDYAVERPADYFMSLCRQIIGQQLSGKVADVIYGRFITLFPRKRVNAPLLLTLSVRELRATGMSGAKVRFTQDLAQKVVAKELDLAALTHLSDKEVIATLTKVKGIGPWTAEMFLMFTLKRPDVFSYGDLGLRRAIAKLYGFRREPTVKQMERIVRKWQPYRTIASRILWAYLDTPVAK